MIRKICVYLDFLSPAHIEKIKSTAAACGFEVGFFTIDCFDEASEYLQTSEILFGNAPDLLAAAPSLKWFCTQYAGTDSYCGKPGLFKNPDCLLTNSSGAYGETISEHTILVLLELFRRMPEFQRAAAEKKWISPLPVKSITGNSFTMLGTGDIGTTIAKKLKALGAARITGISRSGKPASDVYDEIHSFKELDTVLQSTENLIMSLPGTPETYHIIGAREMSLLPEGAYIVNVGRGNAIDGAALIDSLNSGHLAGAALDVFETEPLPEESPVWDAKNLIITPHVAGNMTLQITRNKAVDQFCEDLVRYTAGQPLRRLVDRSRGY